ncbi:restriction endonuclease subunit S [Streptomyces sp. NPDC001812]|uniref:restriction endonuclease subunit S n=1 Tax=Streptomyces sp. NPDC001812 TaxID=3364611 RepID=UPI0036A79EF8
MSLAWDVRSTSGTETPPDKWQVCRVGDLVTLINGHPFPSDSFGPAGDVPLVRIRDLTEHSFETYVTGHVPPSALLQNGDVVIGMDGDFNLVVWDRGLAALNQRLCLLRPRADVDMRFIAYALPSSLKIINDLTFATTVKHLSSTDVLSERIMLPPLEEQRRIANFLDSETTRIGKVRTVADRLQTVLQERRNVQRSLILRGAGVSGPRTSHPMLGDLPALWRTSPLKRLVPRIGVGVVVDPSSYFAEDGVPFLRGSNITEAGIDLTSVRFMSEANSKLLWRSRLNAGDVVVIRAGYPGRAAVVPKSLDGSNCASLLVIKQGTHLLPEYLEAYFNSPLGNAYVDSVRYGAAQEQINVSHVVDFVIPVPPLDEQAAIIAKLQSSERKANALTERLARQKVLLDERRQALITATVTGQFDVSTASGRNVTEGVAV